MTKPKHPVNRRSFLRAGGMALTIPFLEALPLNAYAAPTASNSLRRILFYTINNGWKQSLVFPQNPVYTTSPEGVRYQPLSTMAGDISRMFTRTRVGTLAPKMNLIRGLDNLSTDQTGAGHSALYALGASYENSPNRVRDTIDTVIANAAGFYPTTPYRKAINLLAPTSADTGAYNYSYQNGSQRSLLMGPTNIFNDLFGTGIPGSGGMAPSDPGLSRRLALQHAVSQLSSFAKSAALSTSDKNKLNAHASLINQLLPSLAPPSGGGSGMLSGCSMPIVPSGVNTSNTATPGIQARLRACLDLIYMAFNCQLTNVAVINAYNYSDTEIGSLGDASPSNEYYHQLAGHNYIAAAYLKHKGWIIDQLLYLVNKMNSITESNGLTMLDNSLVVMVSNDGMAGDHTTVDNAILTFGSLGGLIKTGNFINYQRPTAPGTPGEYDFWGWANTPDYTITDDLYKGFYGYPMGQFYATILNALNIPNSGFGEYTNVGGRYTALVTPAARAKSLPVLV